MIEFYKQAAIPRAPIVGEGRSDNVATTCSARGVGGGRRGWVDPREARFSQAVVFPQCQATVFTSSAHKDG